MPWSTAWNSSNHYAIFKTLIYASTIITQLSASSLEDLASLKRNCLNAKDLDSLLKQGTELFIFKKVTKTEHHFFFHLSGYFLSSNWCHLCCQIINCNIFNVIFLDLLLSIFVIITVNQILLTSLAPFDIENRKREPEMSTIFGLQWLIFSIRNLLKLISFPLSSQIHSIFVEGSVSIGQSHQNLVVWHWVDSYNRAHSLDYYQPLSK